MTWGRLLALVSLCGLLLTACGGPGGVPRARSVVPPPIPTARPAVPPETLQRMAAAAPQPGAQVAGTAGQGGLVAIATPQSYRVEAGDTLYSVSRRFQLPLRSLIEANELAPPFTLRTGQSLTIPSQRVHVVGGGDTVYGISRRYGVDMSALVRQNDIAPPYRIQLGQKLVLPDPGAAGPQTGGTPSLAQAPVQSQPLEAPGSQAQPGGYDDVTSGVPSDATAGEPEETEAAETPLLAEQPRPGLPETRPGEEIPAWQREAQAQAQTQSQAQGEAAPAVPQPEQRAAIPTPPAREGGRFLWPLSGELLSGYGPKGDGLHNDGVNIAAPRGTPILAAENGVVAYAGNELRGFGNLLLIKHADGWVTAYAHADRLLVRRGDRVTRGQRVALVGSSGNVSQPQLHFEVRKGTRAVDPDQVLGPRQTASGG